MEIKKIILMVAIVGLAFVQIIGLSGCKGYIKVAGKVIDSETGKGVKGTEVKIISEGEKIPIDTTTTDELGSFIFQKLELEKGKRYKLICEGPTFGKREKEIDPTERESITIVVKINSAIEGTVTTISKKPTPVPEANVYLLAEDKSEIARRSTDYNGRFFFHNISYDKVKLRVECKNYIPCESENVITLKRGEKIELEDIQLEKILSPEYAYEKYNIIEIVIKNSVVFGDL